MPDEENKEVGAAVELETSEHFEHAEHAEHAASSRNPLLIQVSMTIAILAVVAATVGSLESLESGKAISDKNESVLSQNQAADHWAYFQAQSIKRHLYEIAAASTPARTDDYLAKAKGYEKESADIKGQAEALEKERDAKLEDSGRHEQRHHILTAAVTLVHVSIAIATIAIITGGRRWPWYMAMVLGLVGTVVAASAYLA